MGFYRVDGYAQLFGNFIDGQSIYAQPDDLTLFGRQFIAGATLHGQSP